MSWMTNLLVMVISVSISGSIAYICWRLCTAVFCRIRLYTVCYRLFRRMLILWIVPVQFVVMCMVYYRRNGVWSAIPYHADAYESVLSVLSCVWCAGMFVHSVYIIFALYQLKTIPASTRHKNVSEAGKMADAMVYDAWLRDEYGNERLYPGFNWNDRVHVYCAPVPVPMTSVGLKKKIYLPFFDYTKSELSMIVAHELSHIQRGDLRIRECLLVLKVVFWFHPLVYRMFDDFERWSEIACDIDVCSEKYAYVRPVSYFGMLLKNADFCVKENVRSLFVKKYFMSGLSVEGVKLKERIEKAGNYRRMKYLSAITAVIGAVFLILATGTAVFAGGLLEKRVSAVFEKQYCAGPGVWALGESFTLYADSTPKTEIDMPENADTFRICRLKHQRGDYILMFAGCISPDRCGTVTPFLLPAGKEVTLYTHGVVYADRMPSDSCLDIGLKYPDGSIQYFCNKEADYGKFVTGDAGTYALVIRSECAQNEEIKGYVIY